MKKSLKKVVAEDTQKRGPNRYTRLLEDDDDVVMKRGGAPSTVIADLVRKGLAYEALAMGAGDPAIRNLLRTLDQMIQHRVSPLASALEESQRALRQTQLFIASLFLTTTAKFEFPLENCSDEERADLHEQLAVHANDMLNLASAPARAHERDSEMSPPPIAQPTREVTNHQP